VNGTVVALVGGRQLEREALAWLVTAGAGLSVIGTFATADELLDALPAEPRPIVLADVDVHGGVPLEAVADLRRSLPRAKLVLLADEADAAIARVARDQRVEGVVLKSDDAFDVLAALRHVVSGHSVFPGGWHELVAEPHADDVDGSTLLSPRQRQVLDLLAQGMSNEEIAGQLFLSLNTVKFHVRGIYGRLGVHNRVGAARRLGSLAPRRT
jgi:DNA-binding NarL/FixJ family response regulator